MSIPNIIISVRLWANGWSPAINGKIVTDAEGVPIAYATQGDAIGWCLRHVARTSIIVEPAA